MSGLEIRERLAGYVAGDIDGVSLEEWLEEVVWDDALLPIDRQLVYDALRLLSEHNNGDWSEEEVRRKLGAASRTYWLQQATKVVWGGTSAAVVMQPDHQLSAAAGKSPVAESA